MANIKNLQMVKTICEDARISVGKSFFGLLTKVIYVPTNSPVDIRMFEYTSEVGERLKALLDGPKEKLVKAARDFHPVATVNGNFMLEACISHDGAFVALQLLRFLSMSYEPVTAVLFYEGNEAQAVKEMLG